MMRVKLKVCGITSPADALQAIEFGADYLGFNFYPRSPRYLPPERAREIVEGLPERIIPVGIFVNEESPGEVLRLMRESGVRLAQLHGDEDADYCAAVGADRVIKAFRVGHDFQPSRVMEYPVTAVLLDGFDPRLFGGTGKTVDRAIAAIVARQTKVFLAGGLGPENILEAVRQVRPYAVDVNSGVESAPGIKDATKLALLRRQMDLTNNDE